LVPAKAAGKRWPGRCRERRAAETQDAPPPRVWARITRGARQPGATLERTAWLTPYVAETIVEDALAAGRGSRLEMTVATSSGPDLACVERRFAPLSMRGIEVTVRRGDRPAPLAVDLPSNRTPERRRAAGPQPVSSHRLLDDLIAPVGDGLGIW